MLKKRHGIAIVMLLTVVLLGACGKKQATSSPSTQPATLDQVRRHAARALDGNLDSDVRQQAREASVKALVDFLRTQESLRVSQAEWRSPASPDAGPFIRVFESGKTRVYAMSLPGPGVVPPGERLVAQLQSYPVPEAYELSALPGGQIVDARALDDSGQYSLTLAFSVARGGGYVGYYKRDSRTGELKPTSTYFRGLPGRLGELTLQVRDNFLVVATAIPEAWRPRFDPKQPLRLYLDSNVALDWKGKFVHVDESNYTAFQGFTTALDPKVSKTERQEAWDKATQKLPAYLQELESWNEDFTSRLPSGAGLFRSQLANLAVRIVSIPGMESEQSFTVIQHRSGGGLPLAQGITLPGVVEAFRVISRDGLPGLLIVSDGSPRPVAAGVAPTSTGQTGSTTTGPTDVRKYVTLLRLTPASDWEPAPDWFGFLAPEEGWELRRQPKEAHLLVGWRVEPGAQPSVILSGAADAAVQVCQAASKCLQLTWTGGKLGTTDSIVGKLKALTAKGAPVIAQQVQSVAGVVAQFVNAPDIRVLSVHELANALGRNQGVDIQVYEAAPGTRVISLPPNTTGIVPLIVQGAQGTLYEITAPHVVDRWLGAIVIQGGGESRLVVLGKGEVSAVIVTYKQLGTDWVAVNPLDDRLDRFIAERVRITYYPGQTTPVRGIYVRGGSELGVSFRADGTGVFICEGSRECVSYAYDGQWQIR